MDNENIHSFDSMQGQLWDYIDGKLPADKRSFVEELIRTNGEWKEKYEELLDLHHLLENHLELDQPSMRFTQNVMEEIARLHIAPATKTYINKNIIRGIGAFFLVSIIGFIIYAMGQIDWSTPASANNLPFDRLGDVNWGRIFNNTYTNIFLMINTVLGLMLLDMYLGKKKQQWHQGN